MIQINQNLKIEVSLDNNDHGLNSVRIAISSEQYPAISLTPAQARSLATELIQAVHKAEVRHKLQQKGDTQSTQVVRMRLV